jgi:multidrug efflux pump subunit AcrA (membrane-fusion protein)
VTTGLQNDQWVEILEVHSGGSLAPGEQVVVSDHLTLSHEALISVRKTVPPQDRWAFTLDAEGSAR